MDPKIGIATAINRYAETNDIDCLVPVKGQMYWLVGAGMDVPASWQLAQILHVGGLLIGRLVANFEKKYDLLNEGDLAP